MKISMQTHLKMLTVGLLLGLLPGCECPDWIPFCGKKSVSNVCPAGPASSTQFVSPDDTSEVLAYLDDQPLVTRAQIEEQIEMNPQLKAMKSMMDPALLEFQLMNGLIHVGILKKYVTVHNINQQPEYQKKLNQAIESFTNVLNAEFFGQTLPVSVSESDVKEFYEANKDKIPQLMVSRGGVKAACVQFDTEKEARNFVDEVNQTGDIKKVAQDRGLVGKFKDFMVINSQSFGYDPLLKEKILAMQKIPGTEVCKVSDAVFYVVSASGKEEPSYVPFATVKKQLKDYLENEKRRQVMNQELDKLIEQYKVTKSEAGQELAKKAEVNQRQQAMEQEEVSPSEMIAD